VILFLLTAGAGADSGEPGSASWWAFEPLRSPALPAIAPGGSGISNPIDLFLRARLAERGLEPAPDANRRTLIRRLSFDLIGLPPKPEDVEAFLADDEPLAHERLVDRLLASPRHGERWARHWMDVAHFAETHGHDQDRIREHAWPYRDYLVSSFNTDKPYARFVEEQVAGDVLYPDDSAIVPALGFLAAGPWDESSLRDIREDTEDRQIARYLDRDDVVATVMQTFASVTVQCARCHDHKFDPVPTADYYALQAVFAGVDRANRRYDPDPVTGRKRRELSGRLERVNRGDRDLLLSAEKDAEVAAWEREIDREGVSWTPVEAETFLSAGGAALTRQADRSLLLSDARPDRDTYTITAQSPPGSITAVRLEVLSDDSLPMRGPGRADNGNLHLSEFQLLLFGPGAAAGQPVALAASTADFDQDGWTIARAIDGKEDTAWGIHPRVGEPHEAVFELSERLVPPPGSKLVFVLKQLHGAGHLIGRPRLSWTSVEPASRAAILPGEVRQALAIPAAKRGEAERMALAAFHERGRISRELSALPDPALVYAAASDFEPDASHKPAGAPRPVHVLFRGDLHQPREEASPGALTCVKALPARFALERPGDEGSRRATLARWLTSPENPLVWRSIVNRVWHYHFGRGLVDTPNDFGRMGGLPSHPELLDWLAVWFRDQGGSLKELHRLIVTSAAYRQSTRFLPRAARLDAENRLLWRMNRSRLDAESLRDGVLSVAGDLDERMGGPSDRQFDLKPGIHVTPLVDYTKFDVGSAAGHRRSVYRFLFRTLPDPVMDALDCPAGDQLTPVRNASVTPQQALALWNSAFMAHHAGRFACRIRTLAGTPESQIRTAFELALARPPSSEEIEILAQYLRRHGIENLCRLIFNMNEFAFVN
ncbi:MAG TPA: DUF1549 and DUF1553 domain-containing protein, partial [Planctomycetota bacterium]|nr:DUF1549 and DUF1553 domain-containing protein [Planctomycetota bacterium]